MRITSFAGFFHFECIIKETTDGAAASVGIGDCSPLRPRRHVRF